MRRDSPAAIFRASHPEFARCSAQRATPSPQPPRTIRANRIGNDVDIDIDIDIGMSVLTRDAPC